MRCALCIQSARCVVYFCYRINVINNNHRSIAKRKWWFMIFLGKKLKSFVVVWKLKLFWRSFLAKYEYLLILRNHKIIYKKFEASWKKNEKNGNVENIEMGQCFAYVQNMCIHTLVYIQFCGTSLRSLHKRADIACMSISYFEVSQVLQENCVFFMFLMLMR